MGVKQQVFAAGMQQLSQKYKGNGVTHILMQVVNGQPMYVMQGPSVSPPAGLPGRLTVPDAQGRAVAIPIMWVSTQNKQTSALPEGSGATVRPKPHADERDLDDFMWAGGNPIERRDVATQYFPNMSVKEILAGPIPTPVVDPLRLAIDVTGEWGWWTKPFDAHGCLCCTYYATASNVFTYVVPPDYALYIDAWSFDVSQALPIGWQFNVRFLRDGETLLEYNEVVADPLNQDPAHRCVFSSSSMQVQQSYLRIDRNQTFSVVVTPLGLAPFVLGPLDPFCDTLCPLLHGHLEALLDNRDGAPRPKDVGRLRDDLWGTGTLHEVTAEDVIQLTTWLNGVSADAEPAPDVGNRTATSGDVQPKPPSPGEADDSTFLPGSSVSPNPLS